MARFKTYAANDENMVGMVPVWLDGKSVDIKVISIPDFAFNALSKTGETVMFEKVNDGETLAVVSDGLTKHSLNVGAVTYYLGGPETIDGEPWPFWAILRVIEHCIYEYMAMNNALDMDEDGQVMGFRRDVKGRIDRSEDDTED